MTSTDDRGAQVTTTAAAPAIPAQRGPAAAVAAVPGAGEERAAAPAGRPLRAADETARPVLEPLPHDIARTAHGSRAGWILLTAAVAGAAWSAGWVAGVTWAWRAMTPRYLRRTHQRPGAAIVSAR